MRTILKNIAGTLARVSEEHPGRMLIIVGIITVLALALAGDLELQTDVADMLPAHSPAVQSYLRVTGEFGEANTIIVLEGERDRMVEAARSLIPRLEAMELIHVVQATAPVDYFLDGGFMLVDPADLDRTLDQFDTPDLIGVLQGMNESFEAEYTDNEENMRDDEVEIAQGMQGLERALEILSARFDGRAYASIEEAVDAMLVGDPWSLSLDRRMMLIACVPTYPLVEFDYILELTEQLQVMLEDVRGEFPDLEIGLTGNGPLQKDEMDAITTGSVILSMIALVLIYLLLARNFGGWFLPLMALVPLVLGIIWTMGALALAFGSLNLFTVMISPILLGLGIDFAIHLITRFYEERSAGRSVGEALQLTIGGTGVAVLTGGLTTAAAFLALLIGETRGVSEFGFATGAGITLTLLAMFLTLPALLVLRGRSREKRGKTVTLKGASEGWPFIGRVATASWRRPGLFLALFLIVVGLSLWGGLSNPFETDWMELEPKGLENVRLQREIPERFGIMTEGAWLVVDSIEDARTVKERLEDEPMVGEVSAISDILPPAARYDAYRGRLADFSRQIQNARPAPWRTGGSETDLAAEIDRLWTNLDLMSNLAYTAGLDRVVRALDRLTGYDSETDTTDPSAVLPALSARLAEGVDPQVGSGIARAWFDRMQTNLIRMASTQPKTLDDLPEVFSRTMLPRDGSQHYLVNITARDYLWDTTNLRRFADAMAEVDPAISGNATMVIDFLAWTARDGRNGLILAFIVILVLLLITFRGPLGLLALLPLIGGSLMMLGVMHLIGMKYNFMNFMAIPVILGIGIDDGVHALHRFQEQRGEGIERVYNSYRFVGRAILLTTLTTMIGFGSLGFFNHVAMASFGVVLTMGVGACFVTTIIFLPAVTRLLAGSNIRHNHVATTAAALLLALGLTVAGPMPTAAQDTAAGWVERIEQAETVEHSYGVMKQTITTSTGAERTFTIRAWSAEEGDVSLMAYTAPARVAGDRILQLNGGDDIWYYMKRRDTTRHFAGHTRNQSAMGSDFSYEDMASGDFSDDYDSELLGYENYEGVRCVKLKCTPTPEGPSYDHIILWADTEHALTRKIEYYDEDGHMKTLFIADLREVEGRTMAFHVEMVSHRKDSRTVIATEEITFAVEPDQSLFTQAALTRRLPPQ